MLQKIGGFPRFSDSSSYPLWPTDRTVIRYSRLIVLLPDPTQHNRYPRLLYYTFFWTETEVPQAQIDHVHIPREALELINLFISLELIPNKFRWNLVDIMCFQNFEHFQMNFVQSFAPIIHGMHMPNDSSSWSSCCEVCRKVILDVKMYRYSYENVDDIIIQNFSWMKLCKLKISKNLSTRFQWNLIRLSISLVERFWATFVEIR